MTDIKNPEGAQLGATQPGANQARLKSRLTLLVIAALFFAPALIALAMQTPWFHYDAKPTRNFGTLINPVLDTKPWLQQARYVTNDIAGEAPWTLLKLESDACKPACLAERQQLEAVREIQGRNLARVRLQIASTQAEVAAPGPHWTLYQLSAEQYRSLQAALGNAPTGLLLIDPFGNAMMRYPPGFDGTGVRKDLSRMLKISQAGRTTPN